jgi:D-sedoheptulose 7-phosphate isomerase
MKEIYQYINEIQLILKRLPYSQIKEVIRVLREARYNNRQIFLMGNGGSGSTASHFACDLSKNTQIEGLSSYRVICLNDNIPLLLAYANDEGYENVFARQLASLVLRDDVVLVISGSGNSENVIRAIEVGKRAAATTIAFTGFDGGRAGPLVDIHVCVPSTCMEQIEDIHLMLEHLICSALRIETVDIPVNEDVCLKMNKIV